MRFNENNYLPRLIDKQIEDYLKVFGAISVEGPKWCGKTWSSFKHAKSVVYLDDDATKAKALLDINLIFNDDYKVIETMDVAFKCPCTKDKFAIGLASLGKEQLLDILNVDKKAEVVCHYCGEKYLYDEKDLQEIIKGVKK